MPATPYPPPPPYASHLIPDWRGFQRFQGWFRSASSVLISGKVLVFPISAISRDLGDSVDSGDSHGPLPVSLSQPPTPHERFVENKGSTSIRLDCRPSGRSLFLCFSAVKSGPISAFFFRFYCSVGRGSQAPTIIL